MAFSLGKFVGGVGKAAENIGAVQQQANLQEQILAKKQAKLLELAKKKPWGGTVRVTEGDKNFLAGMTYNDATGEAGMAKVEIPGQLVSTMGETADEQTLRKVREKADVTSAELDARLEREPELDLRKSKAQEIGKTEGMRDSDRAGVEADIAGDRTAAELASKIEKEPELAYKVALSKAQAQAEADVAKLGRSNKLAWDTYRKSMDSLSEALGETSTGTFVGLIPAITAKQKTADGAKAIMAPILKSIFRTAGEGNFTDKDQELLMDMVPKRNDPPETVDAKVRMIDSIVSAKLGMSGDTGASTQTQQFGSEDEEYEALLKRRGLK